MSCVLRTVRPASSATHPRGWVCLIALASLWGCPNGVDPSPPDGGPGPIPSRPACTSPGELFPLDASGSPHRLADTGQVPVILGFQGFLFVQLALHSPYEADPDVPIHTRLRTSEYDWQTNHPDVQSLSVSEGVFETRDMTVFFNDQSMSDLVGDAVEIDVLTVMKTCILELHTSAVFVRGS